MEPNNPYIAPQFQQNQQQQTQQPDNQQQTQQADTTQQTQQTQNNQDDVITLDDLFPQDNTTQQQTQQTQQTQQKQTTQQQTQGDTQQQQQTQNTEAETAKLRDEFNQQFQKTNDTVTQNIQMIDKKVERNTELSTFFSKPDNAPFAKYQNEISKVATDPRFIGMKLDRVLPFALGMQTMMKIGAEISTAAAARANQNRTGGSQNMQKVQNQTQGKDWNAMSDADFAAYTAAVQRGERPTS